MYSHLMIFRESVVKKGKISIEIYTVLILFPALLRRKEVSDKGTTYATGPVDLHVRGAPYGANSHSYPRGCLGYNLSAIRIHHTLSRS